jgi:hypothetical protein
MIKCRWVGRNLEFPFIFKNRTEFRETALNALIDARNATVKRYHDGRTRQNCNNYPTLELHIWSAATQRWIHAGLIKEMKTGDYFENVIVTAEGFTICGSPYRLLAKREQVDDKAFVDYLADNMALIYNSLEWEERLIGLVRDMSKEIEGEYEA